MDANEPTTSVISKSTEFPCIQEQSIAEQTSEDTYIKEHSGAEQDSTKLNISVNYDTYEMNSSRNQAVKKSFSKEQSSGFSRKPSEKDSWFCKDFHLSSESETKDNKSTQLRNILAPKVGEKIRKNSIIEISDDERSGTSRTVSQPKGPGRVGGLLKGTDQQKKNRKIHNKYTALFIQKQLQLLENLKQGNSLTVGGVGSSAAAPHPTKQQLGGRGMKGSSYKDKKLKRLREGAKGMKLKRLRSQERRGSRDTKHLPAKPFRRESEKEKPKTKQETMDQSTRESTESDSAPAAKKPKRRHSTEVAKLGLNLEKTYRQIILASKPAVRKEAPSTMPRFSEMDRDDRELSEILKVQLIKNRFFYLNKTLNYKINMTNFSCF